MADKQDNLIDDLAAKIQQLVELYLKVKNERDELMNEVARVRIELGNERLKTNDLQQKLLAQRSVNLDGLSVEEAKFHRNELSKLLREVDKCIALLNK